MIELPKPPTDNLYKFMSIAGLVLFLIGLVTPFILDQQEMEWSWRTTEGFEDRIEVRVMKIAEIVTREKMDPQAQVGELKLIDQSLEALSERETAKIAAQKAKYAELKKARDYALSWTKWLGLVITSVGFPLWWWLVQRPQDVILRCERVKKEAETRD